MLLALWFDFWNPASWTPAPPPVIIVTESPDGGSHGRMDQDDYTQRPAIPDHSRRADDEYWKARETFLKRHLPLPVANPETEHETPIPAVQKLVARHNRIIRSVPEKVPNMAYLRAAEAKVKQLALQIAEIEEESEEEALLALLLG